ncbi:DUF2797 domain-containing protein [Embleya hyalina]|uniref:DUF2797 domain-containing protein n=1 Tax=Embleya hyalina TaxID=516124 RepID=A0A401YWM0_9ACTN|nr:DUF2797 domain-containing protein [Embleya hyalina]GCD98935.1 hypothetical protein EHYA_06647 [Embleya hyalina]
MTVPHQRTGPLATGIHWHDGRAHLALTGPGDEQSRQPLPLGAPTGWRLTGPRTCVGIRRKTGRRTPCPTLAPLPATAPRSQCEACALADPGRKLARDQAMDDPRPFSLYLAWFGPGLVKVGLTATERRAARLADQGAPMFTWLGHGPLIPVRGTERRCSATGTVRERIPHRAKTTAWWRPRELDSPAELVAAHTRLTTLLPDTMTPAPCDVQDLSRFYGLTDAPPPTRDQVTGLTENALLYGELTCVAGHDALITTDTGPLFVDLRLLTGWHLTPARGAPSGLTLKPLDTGRAPDGSVQEGLF